MSSQPAVQTEGPIDQVINSFTAGWDRMVWILFRGPAASLVNWCWWGVILLLAGVVSQGGSGGNTSFPTDNEPLRHADEFLREHWPAVVTAVVVGVLLVAVLVLLFTYLSSRFRLVLLDGVLVGEPAIRGVWGRTASLGLQYFVFRLALGFAMLLAFVPVVLILYRAFAGFDPATASPLQVVTAVLATLGYVIPVVIVFALIDLLSYDLTLPLAWGGGMPMVAALRETLRLITERPAAIFAFVLARIIIGVVALFATCCALCVSVPLWGFPVIVIVGLVILTVAYWPVVFLTAPLSIALALVSAWLRSTLLAPLSILNRAWGYSFVRRCRPTLREFSSAAPPVSPRGGEPPEPIPSPGT
jgi:hypothetical protein